MIETFLSNANFVVRTVAIVVCSASHSLGGDPIITNLTVSQRAGTKLVDIHYNINCDTPTAMVSLEISADGGSTFVVPTTSASGDIGEVSPGAGKSIVWNAGSDWNSKYTSNMRFRIVADDGVVSPPPNFAEIPSGPFMMGNEIDFAPNAPVTEVYLRRFFLSKYEVSKAEWEEVRLWAAQNGYTDLTPGSGVAPNHPIVNISWYDAIKWCNARSEKEGLNPIYRVSGKIMRTGASEPTEDWTNNGYRLPSEAEWEKAARGGATGFRFPWGRSTLTQEDANYMAQYPAELYDLNETRGHHPSYVRTEHPLVYTAPVSSFLANPYGLHHMAGNVSEWCWDKVNSPYVSGAIDPRGAQQVPSSKIIRGGDWNAAAFLLRVSNRSDSDASKGSDFVGFRVARTF